jgi:starch synthase
MASLIPQFFS